MIVTANRQIVTSQPKLPCIDWSNPINKNLIFCAPLNSINRDIVGDRIITKSSGASLGVDYKGESLKGSGSAAVASVPINLSSYTAITISFWMWWDTFANDDKLALEYTANYATNNGFLIDPNSGVPASGYFQAGVGGTSNYNNIRFNRPSAAAWHHYVFTLDKGTGTSDSTAVWVDGVKQTVTAVSGNTDVPNNFANSTLYIFSRNNASLFGAGRMQNLCIRNGIKDAAIIAAEEYKNPWQIFAPDRRPVYFDFGGASVVLEGAATAVGTATGAISVSMPLVGAATATATATGSITHATSLQGAATATSTATADLTVTGGAVYLEGAAVASADASALLTVESPEGENNWLGGAYDFLNPKRPPKEVKTKLKRLVKRIYRVKKVADVAPIAKEVEREIKKRSDYKPEYEQYLQALIDKAIEQSIKNAIQKQQEEDDEAREVLSMLLSL